MSLETMELHGDDVVRVAEALSSATRFKMTRLLSKEKLDISTIAKRLGVSEAYASGEITQLEKLGIIKSTYARGKRGIRKVCELAVRRVIMNLTQGDEGAA